MATPGRLGNAVFQMNTFKVWVQVKRQKTDIRGNEQFLSQLVKYEVLEKNVLTHLRFNKSIFTEPHGHSWCLLTSPSSPPDSTS